MACVVWKNSEKTTQVGTHLGGEKQKTTVGLPHKNVICSEKPLRWSITILTIGLSHVRQQSHSRTYGCR